MIIKIVLESLSPPLGRVAVEGENSQAFHGWLGLLSALSRFVDGEPEAREGAQDEIHERFETPRVHQVHGR